MRLFSLRLFTYVLVCILSSSIALAAMGDPGDSNGDDRVDIFDLSLIALNIGKSNFDPRANMNGDNTVNLFDLIEVAKNFGKTYSSTNPGVDNTYWDSNNNVAVATWSSPPPGTGRVGITWRPAGIDTTAIIGVQWDVTSPHTQVFQQQTNSFDTEAELIFMDSQNNYMSSRWPLGPTVTVPPLPPAVCGDSVCSNTQGETCSTCSQDCGTCPIQVCGDGSCGGGETCSSCQQDCGICPPGGGGQPGDPTLPLLLPVLPTGYTNQVFVNAGGNLQQAINNAQPGTEILLQPGATFTGQYTLPARGDNGWVRIATNLNAPLGVRIKPGTLNLAKLTCTGGNCAALSAGAGSDGWEISLLEITTEETFVNSPLRIHDGGTNVPSRILVDRVYIHPKTPNDRVTRCIIANAAHMTIRDSVLEECHNVGQQAQAIAVWNGPGPFLIENNKLSGSGQALMFGGGQPAPGNEASDITIRRNWLYLPPAWRTQYPAHTAAFETKDAHRVLMEGNIIEGGAFGVLLKSVDQLGGCPTTCGTEHITFRRNIIRQSGSGFNLARKAEGGPAILMHDILIEDVILENIGPGGTWNYQGSGRQLQLLAAPHNLRVRGYTTSQQNAHSWLILDDPPTPKGSSITFEDVLVRGPTQYGLFTNGGNPISASYTTVNWNNVYGDCQGGNVPSCNSNPTPTAGADVSLVNAATNGVAN